MSGLGGGRPPAPAPAPVPRKRGILGPNRLAPTPPTILSSAILRRRKERLGASSEGEGGPGGQGR